MSEIKKGCVARCSRGLLGIVTSNTKLMTRYGEPAWLGLHLSPSKAGEKWCSRNPTLVANSIEELVQPWISIDMQSPADGEIVLATDEDAVDQLRYYEGFGFESIGGDVPPFAVTRWMPKPLPPEKSAYVSPTTIEQAPVFLGGLRRLERGEIVQEGDCIVESLRTWSKQLKRYAPAADHGPSLLDDAAAAIERLQSENEALNNTGMASWYEHVAVMNAWTRCDIAQNWPTDENGSPSRCALSMEQEIRRLRSCIEGDARCPCCDTTVVCLDGCTFADDAPAQHEKMVFARKVLKPKEQA